MWLACRKILNRDTGLVWAGRNWEGIVCGWEWDSLEGWVSHPDALPVSGANKWGGRPATGPEKLPSVAPAVGSFAGSGKSVG